MPRFAANLTFLFNELPFVERFAAARTAGFDAVEFISPYGLSVGQLGQLVEENQLAISVFNLPAGDWEAGERGLAALPGREAEFQASVGLALQYAQASGATQLHMMAGITAGMDHALVRQTYLANLRYAAERLAEAGLTLLIEPINTRDMPGYFLAQTDQAVQVIEEVALPNLKLQFDIYHHQISRGDVSRYLERLMPVIGHIQIASIPARQEPDTGELDYRHVFRLLDELGYTGWVGCEYRPRVGTVAGLGWLIPY